MKTLLIAGLTALFALFFGHSFGQCQADYTGDGLIDLADLTPFMGDYNLGQNCLQCDLNNDGIVDQQDVTTFQGLIGASCAIIPTNCPADYTGDGIINASDLTLFQTDYALGQSCVQCDLNGDGIVGQNDATLFQGLFGTSCTNDVTGCPGDYNNDGAITAADLPLFITDYSNGQNCVQCDINGNGIVDTQDYALFRGLFGTFCSDIPTDCPADYNNDGTINSLDVSPFLADYALGQNCVQCDLNGDGDIDQQDVLTMQGLLGTDCVKTKSLGHEEVESLEIDMVMYPNPTSNVVNILLNNGTGIDSESTLQVVDLAGRVIEHLDISSEQGVLTLNVESFESGTYFISLTNRDQQYNAKLTVK